MTLTFLVRECPQPPEKESVILNMGQHEIFPTEMQKGKDTVPVSTHRISKNTETISKAEHTCDEKHTGTCDEKHTCTCNTIRKK